MPDNMKVLVEAYGCTLNRGEAEEFSESLLGKGHELAATQEEAEAFAVFTCGVIETTERHMLRRIKELARFPGKPLIVAGCLPNICPEKVLKSAPHASLVGPAKHMSATGIFAGGTVRTVNPRRSTIAMLPIATGCNGDCAYCITRKARGPIRSRSQASLESRLRESLGRGAVEIQLCAQDTAAYGSETGNDLGSLVETLGNLEGDFMMRIGMMNPASAIKDTDSVLRAYENPKVFKFLHLPVQSGSQAMLDAMNRRHTVMDFLRIVRAFRERFPGMALSTDVIVGFPGEREDDFMRTINLMEDVRPDIINVTRFSSRPGTPAHQMGGRVPSRVAKDRSRLLTQLRFSLTARNYEVMLGNEVRALATERRKPGTTFLRTAEYKPVVVKGELDLGRWYDLTIEGAARTHLFARLQEACECQG